MLKSSCKIPNSSKRLILTGLAYSILAMLYAFPNLLYEVIKCPTRMIYNIKCPGCNTTTAIIELLSGNLLKAFLLNPLTISLIMLLPIVTLIIIWDVVNQDGDSIFELFLNVLEIDFVKDFLFLVIMSNWIYVLVR